MPVTLVPLTFTSSDFSLFSPLFKMKIIKLSSSELNYTGLKVERKQIKQISQKGEEEMSAWLEDEGETGETKRDEWWQSNSELMQRSRMASWGGGGQILQWKNKEK